MDFAQQLERFVFRRIVCLGIEAAHALVQEIAYGLIFVQALNHDLGAGVARCSLDGQRCEAEPPLDDAA